MKTSQIQNRFQLFLLLLSLFIPCSVLAEDVPVGLERSTGTAKIKWKLNVTPDLIEGMDKVPSFIKEVTCSHDALTGKRFIIGRVMYEDGDKLVPANSHAFCLRADEISFFSSDEWFCVNPYDETRAFFLIDFYYGSVEIPLPKVSEDDYWPLSYHIVTIILKKPAQKKRISISGRVLSEEKPLSGVPVLLRCSIPLSNQGYQIEGFLCSITDADGKYRFSNVIPGPYSLLALCGNEESAIKEIPVPFSINTAEETNEKEFVFHFQHQEPIPALEANVNVNELAKLRQFLETANDVGMKNGLSLSVTYRSDLPETYPDLEWVEKDGELYLASLKWDTMQLTGDLDLSGFSHLQSVTIRSQLGNLRVNISNCPLLEQVEIFIENLSGLNLEESSAVKSLTLYTGDMRVLDLSDQNKLEVISVLTSKNFERIILPSRATPKIRPQFMTCAFSPLNWQVFEKIESEEAKIKALPCAVCTEKGAFFLQRPGTELNVSPFSRDLLYHAWVYTMLKDGMQPSGQYPHLGYRLIEDSLFPINSLLENPELLQWKNTTYKFLVQLRRKFLEYDHEQKMMAIPAYKELIEKVKGFYHQQNWKEAYKLAEDAYSMYPFLKRPEELTDLMSKIEKNISDNEDQCFLENKFVDSDGKPVDMTQFRGHHVLVNNWKTTSSISLARIRERKQIYEQFKNYDLLFLEVNCDQSENREKAEATIKKLGIPWVNVFLDEVKDKKEDAIEGYLLLDPNGRSIPIFNSLKEILAEFMYNDPDLFPEKKTEKSSTSARKLFRFR